MVDGRSQVSHVSEFTDNQEKVARMSYMVMVYSWRHQFKLAFCLK